MNRKLAFWGYFLFLLVAIIVIPVSMAGLPVWINLRLFFGFVTQNFLLTMLSVFGLLFDYASIIIPRTELSSVQIAVLVRHPTGERLYVTYFRFLVIYLLPFTIVKAYALIVHLSLITLIWFLLAIVIWTFLLLFRLGRDNSVSEGIILIMLIGLRVVASLLIK